jgi:hypothetical protein
MAGNLIAYSSAGTGTFTITYATAIMSGGEFAHRQLTPETPYDFISALYAANGLYYDLASASTGGGLTALTATLTEQATSQGYYSTGGPGVPMNVVQPSINMNMFIKL